MEVIWGTVDKRCFSILGGGWLANNPSPWKKKEKSYKMSKTVNGREVEHAWVGWEEDREYLFKPEGKRSRGRPRGCRWENNIKTHFK